MRVALLTNTSTGLIYFRRKDQIKLLNAGPTPHTYTLLLVPRRTILCDRILEEEGVLGEVNISSYKLEFIPLEEDLISLEWDNVWRELYVVRSMRFCVDRR